ncbi:MAG: late competence development ComFB family protein [Oscillospiraceae bacterium]|jgi:competence protein ComFB|nr:late competence development ComFB family protein [Oscillospiraceae bacterium]
MLHNIVEDLVEDWLERILAEYTCCKCAKCRMDMMAMSLNKLKPHYVVARDAYSRVRYLDTSTQNDIMMAVVTSVEFIKDHPRHEG